MIVGSGLIAERFSSFSFRPEYLLLAEDLDEVKFDSERTSRIRGLYVEAIRSFPHATVVCFASLAPVCADGENFRNELEELVKTATKKSFIFRIPYLVGNADAKVNYTNYLVEMIRNSKTVETLTDGYFLDVDDVYDIVAEAITNGDKLGATFNVGLRDSFCVRDLVTAISNIFGKNAEDYASVRVLPGLRVDSEVAEVSKSALNLSTEESYLDHAVKKYFNFLLSQPKLISVIVPTYNEEHGIEEFYRRTKSVVNALAPRFDHEFIFVNDFSTDKTLSKLKLLAKADKKVKFINFSRNFGNQIGITAGIDQAKGDIAVIIDDDLQDPPEIIPNLLSQWYRGYKVVYGVRPKRQGVNLFFKLAAKLYYRIIGGLSETKIPNDTGDFRLIDRAVIETLKNMKEESRYYRGMVAWVGFSQVGVSYERDRRYAGVSTFSIKKYINFALNGLTSFTEKPLYFSSLIGLVVTSVSFVLAVILVVSKVLDPELSIRGWTSLTVIILFFGGIQLLCMGIVGIYISKIYREVKGRPLYIIESTGNIE